MSDVRELITQEARRYTPYAIRFDKFKTDSIVPFRLSPKPLRLRRSGIDIAGDFRKGDENILTLGPLLCEFFYLVKELYNSNERVRELLDRGKPDWYKRLAKPEYLFLRPDLILSPVEQRDGKTKSSFFICEIETSPFGLGLAEMLNRAYCDTGFETIVARDKLKQYLHNSTPPNGVVACSKKCAANFDQLRSLADQVFSGSGRQWSAQMIDDSFSYDTEAIYRAFYLSEIFSDEDVKNLVLGSHSQYFPSLTPQFEEKAILALPFHTEFEDYFLRNMGPAGFHFIREIFPPAWIVGEERYFSLGMPDNISSTAGLASLGQSKRKWVIKESGFGEHSSWGQGVTFAHTATRPVLEAALEKACTSTDVLYVCQEFRDGVKRKVSFFAETEEDNLLPKDTDGNPTLDVRVRLCMYYSNIGKNIGEIVASFATCCADGIYVHGKSNSIQTAVVI